MIRNSPERVAVEPVRQGFDVLPPADKAESQTPKKEGAATVVWKPTFPQVKPR